jgi:hypothetical protein
LQIYDLALQNQSEWHIFVDADTLIHPDCCDITEHLKKDIVCHNSRDLATIRWSYDKYFRRDGRHFGSCNWFAAASEWCTDLWRPLDDLTPEEAIANIHITEAERMSGCCRAEHLIDDYALSRNIARFGLKCTTMKEICGGCGYIDRSGKPYNPWMWHTYLASSDQKLIRMLAVLSGAKDEPAFEKVGRHGIGLDGVPIMTMPNGQVIRPCGRGWGLMTREEALAYRKSVKVDDECYAPQRRAGVFSGEVTGSVPGPDSGSLTEADASPAKSI